MIVVRNNRFQSRKFAQIKPTDGFHGISIVVVVVTIVIVVVVVIVIVVVVIVVVVIVTMVGPSNLLLKLG